MAEPLRIPWPMWKCHYFLLGGNRKMGPLAGILPIALLVGYFGFQRILYPQPVAGWALNFLAGAQAFLLVIGGCNAVYRAMLRDYESKMIESHRLTPMSNSAVAVGYLFGATLQVLLIYAIVFVFGALLSWFSAGVPTAWMVGNIVLLNGALTLWAIVVFTGMRPAKPISPAGPIVGVAAFANAGLLMVPGVGIMLSAYSSALGLGLMWGLIGLNAPGTLALLLVQLVLTAYWVAAAAAKYRRPDLPALNAARGTVLLCLWLLFASLGMVAFDLLATTAAISRGDRPAEAVQWSITLILSLFVALAPLNGSVHCRILALRGASLRGWGDRFPDWATAVLAATLIVGVMFLLGAPVWRPILTQVCQYKTAAPPSNAELLQFFATRWAATFLACLFAMLSVRAVLAMAYVLTRSPKLTTGVFIFVAWILPPGIDVSLAAAFADFSESIDLSVAFGCSALGTVLLVWHDLPGPLGPGLIVQAALALVLSFFAARTLRKLSGATTAPPAAKAVSAA